MHNINKQIINILGINFSFGQKKNGVQLAPEVIRANGCLENLDQKYEVYDFGNIDQDLKKDPGSNYKNLHDQVKRLSKYSGQKLFLGGDHGISFATISALLSIYPNLRIIWVDAHADINTPSSSPSGNLHGMPLAALMGLIKKNQIKSTNWLKPCLIANRVAYIGLRDIDPQERKFIKDLNIKCFTAHQVKIRGMKKVIQEAIDAIDPFHNNPLHLSFDIDSVDPLYAPSTGTSVKNGLTQQDVNVLAKNLYETQRLVSCEVVELNPLINTCDNNLTKSLSVIKLLINNLFNTAEIQPEQKINSAAIPQLLL